MEAGALPGTRLCTLCIVRGERGHVAHMILRGVKGAEGERAKGGRVAYMIQIGT